MHYFIIGAVPENLHNPLRRLTCDAAEFFGSVICKAARKLFRIILAAKRHDVPLLEAAFHALHADGQQASSLLSHCLLSSLVEHQPPAGLCCEANPALTRCNRWSLRKEQPSDSLAG